MATKPKQTTKLKGGVINRHKAMAMGKKIPVGKGESEKAPKKGGKK